MAKNTISQATTRSGRSSAVEDERLKRQFRQTLNATYSTTATMQSDGGGGLEVLWTDADPLPFDSDATVQVKVKGVGVSAPSTDYAYYEKIAHFTRGSSGAAAQNGSTVDKVIAVESDAAFNCTLAVGADSKIVVKVDDGAVASMDWKIWVEVRRDT